MRTSLSNARHGTDVLRPGVLAISLGIYLAGLVVMAPATLVDASLKHASNGRMRLAEARGTMWSGTGLFEIRDQIGQTGVTQGLVWHFLPRSLLRGNLEYKIKLDQSRKTFPVRISPSRIDVTDAEFKLPARVLGMGVTKLAPLGLLGEVILDVHNLSIGRSGFQGEMALEWRLAGSALTPDIPFGDYKLSIQIEDRAARAALLTLQGPLEMTGEGSWSNDRSSLLDLPIVIRVPEAYRERIAPFLRMISVERGEGRFDLQLR